MRMWTLIPALLMTAALAAGCGEQTPRPKTAGGSAPTTASAGAGGAGSSAPAGPAAPKSESESLPGSQQSATKGAEAKPDPGDANDHSNPQHDARNKKDRD